MSASVSPQSFPHLWKNLWKFGRKFGKRWTDEHLGAGPRPRRRPRSSRHSVLHLVSADDVSSAKTEPRSRCRVPNAMFIDWLHEHYSRSTRRRITEARAKPGVTSELRRRDIVCRWRPSSLDRTKPPASEHPGTVSPAAVRSNAMHDASRVRKAQSTGAEPTLHLRHVHRRVVESIRSCSVPRGRRSAVALMQPAVHLRRCRIWARPI